MTYLAIIFSVVFINNILLSNLMGFPLLSKETKMRDLVVEGLKTLVVGLITIMVIFPIYKFLLLPDGIEYFALLFVVIIAALVTILVNKAMIQLKLTEEKVGNFSLLTTANVVIIVAGLLVTNQIAGAESLGFFGAVVTVLGLTLGHLLVVLMIYVTAPKISLPGVPKAFKGIPLMLITIGLFAMVFMGLNGIF